ncbi:MAG: hypothetical protein HLX51_08840 [Micrococcaceae bacterium]|nr:hypothetical protein [Micrococcaceae bacterium]
MKTLSGIGSIILGVVAILASVGLQTIWAPPAEFNATTSDTQEAPLTLITDDIDVDPDEAIEYTLSGDGEFTLMYGQLRDIEAWVGDAAHNRIASINTDVERGEDPTVETTYVDGEAEVPNPANSDLWLATQEVTDEVTQRWAQHDAGEWALLVAADGTAPAPTEFSVSWVNIEPDSPWITPLMIAGIALVVIGIVLLIWRFVDFRRRAKRTSGRRAAVRGDYTGITAADVVADRDNANQTMTIEQVDAGEPVEDAADDQPTQVVTPVDLSAETQAADAASAKDDGNEVEDIDDNDDPSDDNDDTDDTNSGARGDEATDTAPVRDDMRDDEKGNGFLRRTITALSALGLAVGLGTGPAHAETETPAADEDIEEQVDEETVEEEVDPEEPDSFPVVVDAQFERIIGAVSAAVAEGDAEGDAEQLTGRVDGQALSVREESYRNNSIDEDYAMRTDVAAEDILATWMVQDAEFPRTIYAVTSDEEGAATQLLVLRQDDARSQYKLIQNAPFAPGAELPPGNLADHQVEPLGTDDSTDLVMSPDAAVEALSEYLTDPSADAADAVADNEWIDSVHEYQQELTDSHEEQETDVSISRTIFDDSVNSVRLPDGSALVFGAMNSMESLTPSEDSTVQLNELTQELGEFESAEQEDQVRIRYREQFALLVPPEGEVSLVGYETVQSTVDSPSN